MRPIGLHLLVCLLSLTPALFSNPAAGIPALAFPCACAEGLSQNRASLTIVVLTEVNFRCLGHMQSYEVGRVLSGVELMLKIIVCRYTIKYSVAFSFLLDSWSVLDKHSHDSAVFCSHVPFCNYALWPSWGLASSPVAEAHGNISFRSMFHVEDGGRYTFKTLQLQVRTSVSTCT